MRRWIFLRSSPGKRALPVISSAMMQPTDQMSTGIEKQRLRQLRISSMTGNIQMQTYMLRGISGAWFGVGQIDCTVRMVGQEAHFYPEHCLLYNCIEHYLTLDCNPIVNNCVKYTVLLFATLMFQHQDRKVFYVYYILSILVKMAKEDTTCRYSKVGATDFCLCTSRGFEGKRFLTVKHFKAGKLSAQKSVKLGCFAIT